MSDPSAKVSVVIPNHNGITPRNGLKYLEMVLPTLSKQTFRDFEVTVVDNASTDGSVEYLRRSWPDVRIVELAENTGFPLAVNRGIGASDGEYIALLNNDVELSADWMGVLTGELDRDPQLGFVTGKVMRFGERGVIEQLGQDIYTCGRFQPRGLDEVDSGQYDDRRPVPIVTAAAALYRRAAVERVEGFDEDYFLYCEDVDLCLRILLAGYSGLYVPQAEAYHVRGGTTGRESDLHKFYVVRNTLTTLLKDMPASVLLRALPKVLLFQYELFRTALEAGWTRTLLRSWASFLRTVPRTLRKRLRVQRERGIAPASFGSLLRTEYPFAARLQRLPPARQGGQFTRNAG